MKYLRVIVILAVFIGAGCANTNMPKTTLNGVPIGGGSAYCVFLSAFVGALGGGFAGTMLAANQGSTGNSTVAWGSMTTALGAGLGGMTGYGLCAPTPAASPASEPLIQTAHND